MIARMIIFFDWAENWSALIEWNFKSFQFHLQLWMTGSFWQIWAQNWCISSHPCMLIDWSDIDLILCLNLLAELEILVEWNFRLFDQIYSGSLGIKHRHDFLISEWATLLFILVTLWPAGKKIFKTNSTIQL